MRMRALCAQQIRRAHGRKLEAIERFGRERDRDAENGAFHGRAPQDFPERLALAAHLDRRRFRALRDQKHDGPHRIFETVDVRLGLHVFALHKSFRQRVEQSIDPEAVLRGYRKYFIADSAAIPESRSKAVIEYAESASSSTPI